MISNKVIAAYKCIYYAQFMGGRLYSLVHINVFALMTSIYQTNYNVLTNILAMFNTWGVHLYSLVHVNNSS